MPDHALRNHHQSITGIAGNAIELLPAVAGFDSEQEFALDNILGKHDAIFAQNVHGRSNDNPTRICL